MRDLYATAIDDLLAQECTPAVVRNIEKGGDPQGLWNCLRESGFADALAPESEGGAGLVLADAFVVFERCGAHALPLPFAETLLARALLGAAGLTPSEQPAGPITWATVRSDAGALHADLVPAARSASHVVAHDGARWWLLEVAAAEATPVGFVLDAGLSWSAGAMDQALALRLPVEFEHWPPRVFQACVYAAQLAGAATRVVDMTLAYANQRLQFGRAIGKFQVVQHHLAVMSEQAAAARMAAEIGCLSTTWRPDPLRAALAKARASEAALEIARLAHQVHGAIGFTEELDLQLYTRRLHAWRRAGGSESGWQAFAGERLLAGGGPIVDALCGLLQPSSCDPDTSR